MPTELSCYEDRTPSADNDEAPVPTSAESERVQQILPAWPALNLSRSAIRTPLGPRPSFVNHQSTSNYKSGPQASPLKSRGKLGTKKHAAISKLILNAKKENVDGTKPLHMQSLVGDEAMSSEMKLRRDIMARDKIVMDLQKELEEQKKRNKNERDKMVSELEQLTSTFQRLADSRDTIQSALDDAEDKISEYELEVLVLKEGMQEQDRELLEAARDKESAKAEIEGAKSALLESGMIVVDQRESLARQFAEIQLIVSERDEVSVQFETTRQELYDALDRETRQEEAIQELMSTYAEALSQLGSWKQDHGLEYQVGFPSIRALQTQELGGIVENERDDVDCLEEEEFFGNQTLEDYDVVDSREMEIARTDGGAKPQELRSTPSFGSKLRTLVVRKHSRNRPSSHAIRLFAIRELEDDMEEYKYQLRELCDEFAEIDSSRLRKLQKQESKIEECMKNTRLTATKLRAVRGSKE